MKTNLNTLKSKRNPELGFRIHFIVFLLTMPVVWLVWYLTNTNYPWPIWSTLTWAVGVLFHFLGVSVFTKK